LRDQSCDLVVRSAQTEGLPTNRISPDHAIASAPRAGPVAGAGAPGARTVRAGVAIAPPGARRKALVHGSRLRARRGGPVPRHPLATLRLDARRRRFWAVVDGPRWALPSRGVPVLDDRGPLERATRCEAGKSARRHERSEGMSRDDFPDRGSRTRTASAGAARARQREALRLSDTGDHHML